MVTKYIRKLNRETAPYEDTGYTHKAVLYSLQLAEHEFPESVARLKASALEAVGYI